MSQRVLVVLASTLLSLGWLGTSAHADTLLGVYAGAGNWQQDYSGSVTTLDTTLGIEDDLGLAKESNNVFYAALEHPVPLLPNLRAAYADLDTRANVTLIQDVGFAGANFTSATDVSVSYTHLTLPTIA